MAFVVRISDWSADVCSSDLAVGAGDEAVAGCHGASRAGGAFRGGGSGAGDQGPAQAAPAPSRDLWPSVQLPDSRYDGGTIPPFMPAQECPCPLPTSAAPADRKSTRLNSSH